MIPQNLVSHTVLCCKKNKWWLPVQVHEKSDLLHGRAVEEKICGGYQFKCMRNQAYCMEEQWKKRICGDYQFKCMRKQTYCMKEQRKKQIWYGYQFKCMRNQTYCMEEQEKKR